MQYKSEEKSMQDKRGFLDKIFGLGENSNPNNLPALINQSKPPVRVKAKDWAKYETVNDPETNEAVPDEGHEGSDWEKHEDINDDWSSWKTVNDPETNEAVPDEGHEGSDWEKHEDINDDWSSWKTVNDPETNEAVPDEGHEQDIEEPPIYITESCHRSILDIYSSIKPNENEYPTLGVVIQGSSIFTECVRYPESAIKCGPTYDRVNGKDPEFVKLWAEKLHKYNGKCRFSSIHIHPMNMNILSSYDVRKYSSNQKNLECLPPLGLNKPYPVILLNLNSMSELEILGFWVDNMKYKRTEIKIIPDHSKEIIIAFRNAQPTPYFSKENRLATLLNSITNDQWTILLGVNEDKKALKISHESGQRFLLPLKS